jgi:hypothetical protein
MEAFDNAKTNKEPTPEALGRMLEESLIWLTKITKRYTSEYDPKAAVVSATTQETNAKNMYGELVVKDTDDGFRVKFNEIDYERPENNVTQWYTLQYAYGVGSFELMTTGVQPNITYYFQESDSTEEHYEQAFAAHRDFMVAQLEPATPREIQHFVDVVEVALLGNAFFDFKQFESDLGQHLDDLETLREIELGEDDTEEKNHPE